MIDSRRFTTEQGFSDNLDRLFQESAGLEQEIRKQLAGLRYE
jgi:type I restriction enzyme M protein